MTKAEQQDGTGLPPDPEGMNDQRANAGGMTLAYFAMTHGELADDNSLDAQNMTDLLADLAHYCDREGLNLTTIWESAAHHYAEETDNQGEQMDAIPSNYGERESESATPSQ
jgi:hypothetical protein